MNIAWKEMKRSKTKFMILGTIIFLVSFLTFMISGLANGLSLDSAGFIKAFPEGHFYMSEDADQSFSFSKIDPNSQVQILNKHKDAMAFSIQMGYLDDQKGKQRSFAIVAATESHWLKEVKKGEIILDKSLQDEGFKIGDSFTSEEYNRKFVVKGFLDQSKYSHVPVAYIHIEDYKGLYGNQEMQLIFIPNKGDAPRIAGLDSYSEKQFLNTISSYKSEQLSLNMIIWFLLVISGMLFAIFFYMMNVQKMGLYGILKAIGVKTSSLFNIMWTQMAAITVMALTLSISFSHIFNRVAPTDIPFSLTLETIAPLSIVFFVIGFIGATIAGFQVKNIQPLQAIQQGEM